MVTWRLLVLETLFLGGFVPACGGVASDAGATGGADPAQSGGSSPSAGGGAAASPAGAGATGGGGLQTGSGGMAASCSNGEPCGGDVVGTWTVMSSCLALSGEIDAAPMGIPCSSLPVTGTLEVSGTWTANADGTYADDLSWSGIEQLTVPAECGAAGATPVTCDRLVTSLMGLGYYEGLEYASLGCEGEYLYDYGCSCLGVVEQNQDSEGGTYSVSADVVTTSGGLEFSYCVAGNTMIMTPLAWSPDTSMTPTGTVVLQRQ
jgi:hypothetical protein